MADITHLSVISSCKFSLVGGDSDVANYNVYAPDENVLKEIESHKF